MDSMPSANGQRVHNSSINCEWAQCPLDSGIVVELPSRTRRYRVRAIPYFDTRGALHSTCSVYGLEG